MDRTLLPLLVGLLAVSSCTRQAPTPEPPRARNVILFIGDGMSVATVTAARIFVGQANGLPGEEHSLSFEAFPNVALVKTYNTNQQVADSAGTATAMVTGTKTRAGVISVHPSVPRRDCAQALERPLPTIGEMAKARGLSVGFVTTARATHATPATLYAHAPERDWETNLFLPRSDWDVGCRDIAFQLTNSDIDVALGGGLGVFFGSNLGGARRDPGDNLVAGWQSAADNRRFVRTATELESTMPGEQVLGLFAPSHLTYVAERNEDSQEPTLTDMATKAVDLLSANDAGFFLMVESGRIDHAHHDGKPGYAMLETQEFDRAIAAVLDKVDLSETLVMVTADHSHVFTMGGYATRGNPILGLVVTNDKSGEPNGWPSLAADGKPYTTLSYANGPGAVEQLPRPEPETGVGMLAQALIPMRSENIDGSVTNDETHGGEDVALYAIGPGADNARGVIEQNVIFDIMRNAFGWPDEGD